MVDFGSGQGKLLFGLVSALKEGRIRRLVGVEHDPVRTRVARSLRNKLSEKKLIPQTNLLCYDIKAVTNLANVNIVVAFNGAFTPNIIRHIIIGKEDYI